MGQRAKKYFPSVVLACDREDQMAWQTFKGGIQGLVIHISTIKFKLTGTWRGLGERRETTANR